MAQRRRWVDSGDFQLIGNIAVRGDDWEVVVVSRGVVWWELGNEKLGLMISVAVGVVNSAMRLVGRQMKER
jgi:hypothetical protein